MKTTYKASSDIALVKYWGKKNKVLRLPENGSVSIILDGLDTVTTVEFDGKYPADTVKINGDVEDGEELRVVAHLDRIRKLAKVSVKARVESENTFPKGTGLSSSGSGFSALTYAATRALGLEISEKEISILARQGSGTACRCACGGFVEWADGNSSETSYSKTMFSSSYWDVRDVVVVVDEGKKLVSSTQGHALANTSVFYRERLKHIKAKIRDVKKAIQDKNFSKLGPLVEAEALEFHSILLTSHPSMIAWYPGTVEVMLAVQQMRREGIEAYFTINTGFNVHVLTLPVNIKEVQGKLEKLNLVKKILLAKVGEKPKELSEHLF
jgi:diphosphomevalonate decarboxylase